jgi:hypothetical protein
MADLKSIAELAWRQLYPNPSDETKISKEEFLATAKTEYAYQLWKLSKEEKREEGEFQMPSYLITESDPLPVVENAIDVSGLKILRGLDTWLQNVGGLNCDCRYVKTTINHAQIFCGDDSMGDDVRTFLEVGNRIVFPQGTHEKEIRIMYANNGEEVDDKILIDDTIGGVVRNRLIEIYGGKVGAEDKTNNSNPET